MLIFQELADWALEALDSVMGFDISSKGVAPSKGDFSFKNDYIVHWCCLFLLTVVASQSFYLFAIFYQAYK